MTGTEIILSPAAARQSFDPARATRGVVESVAETIDSGIEAMLEIDKSVQGPKQGAKLFASDQFAGVVK